MEFAEKVKKTPLVAFLVTTIGVKSKKNIEVDLYYSYGRLTITTITKPDTICIINIQEQNTKAPCAEFKYVKHLCPDGYKVIKETTVLISSIHINNITKEIRFLYMSPFIVPLGNCEHECDCCKVTTHNTPSLARIHREYHEYTNYLQRKIDPPF